MSGIDTLDVIINACANSENCYFRSMAEPTFHSKVVAVVKRIPRGRVATYGQIAGLAGSPRAARQVVRTLHSSSRKENLPWYRVINSQGRISLGRGSGYEEQLTLLQAEGVAFKLDGSIDLSKSQWRPRIKQ